MEKLPSRWTNPPSLRSAHHQVKERKALATVRDAVIRSLPAFRDRAYRNLRRVVLLARCRNAHRPFVAGRVNETSLPGLPSLRSGEPGHQEYSRLSTPVDKFVCN